MKYRYGFVTGNETVEVPEEWAAVLREMDQEEMNNGRRETRRHSSLEKLLEEGVDFAAPGNAESVLMENEYSPETEKALDCLTETQRRRLLMYCEGMTYMEIAKQEGVSFQKIGKSVQQAKKNFEKFFDEG